jgi:hypothetical protein
MEKYEKEEDNNEQLVELLLLCEWPGQFSQIVTSQKNKKNKAEGEEQEE